MIWLIPLFAILCFAGGLFLVSYISKRLRIGEMQQPFRFIYSAIVFVGVFAVLAALTFGGILIGVEVSGVELVFVPAD